MTVTPFPIRPSPGDFPEHVAAERERDIAEGDIDAALAGPILLRTPEQRAADRAEIKRQLDAEFAEAERMRRADLEQRAARSADLAAQMAEFAPLLVRPTLAGYLSDVEAFLRRYVAFPSEHEPVAIALWVAHAHLIDRFETSPILAVTSAEKRSGKTRVLDCLELLAPNPWRTVIPSEAVTYTVLAQRPYRTMLLDEADAIFGPRTAEKYEGLRAVLNAGNRRGTSVPRVEMQGKKREVVEFDVFGPKAIAGIGNLPDTVADRAIPIRMKRRAPSEPVAKFRQRFARPEAAAIRFNPTAVPDVPDVPVPEGLNDRAADSWEPLLQIAAIAGGEWEARARMAAIALSSDEDVSLSLGMRLLADIREAFAEDDHLPTAELLRRLHALDDAPWGDWKGKPLTARQLAWFLEPYRVNPSQRRLRGEKSRGYFRTDLTDAWDRYVGPQETGTSGTSGTEDVGLPLRNGIADDDEDDYPASAIWPDEEPDPPTAFDEVMG